MNAPKQNVNPTLNFATKSVLKIFRNIFLLVIGFNGIFFAIIGLAFSLGSINSLSYSGETTGTVTGVSRSVSDGSEYCTYTYDFIVDGKRYVGESPVGTSTSCAYSTGSAVNITYDQTKPTSNSSDTDDMSIYFGLTFLVIGIMLIAALIIGIIVSIQLSKREDANNDGLPNDGMPATKVQLNMIQNGMRDLGEFWVPHKMTQQEAREMILTIEQRLAEQNKPFDPR